MMTKLVNGGPSAQNLLQITLLESNCFCWWFTSYTICKST